MNPATNVRVGGYDWLTTWRLMYDAERAQGEAATDPAFGRSEDAWAGRAQRYASAMRQQTQPDPFMRWLLPQLRLSDRVLDVGAGTGRYLPFLAQHVRQVIAVEPSPAMRAELAHTLHEAGVQNVQVIPGTWPLAEPIQADVLISAHVVYGVREIGPFLEGCATAARRLCALWLGLQHPTSTLAPFWERVHGEPRLPLPGALEALAACYQLGLPANLALLEAGRSFRFPSLEVALEEIRMRLRLTPEPSRDAAILAAITELLEPTADGALMPRGPQLPHAVVWWTNQEQS
ncbi:MAG: class I SAM-dependent methyltransferase [Oscillochloridaceae bacterium umkhey_bin13]